MAADHRLDAGVDQRVEHRIDLGAGNAEDVLDALCLEVRDQELRAVAVDAHLAAFFDLLGRLEVLEDGLRVISALVAAGKPA